MSDKQLPEETQEPFSFTQEVEDALVGETLENEDLVPLEVSQPIAGNDEDDAPQGLLGASVELDMASLPHDMTEDKKALQTASWVKKVSEELPHEGGGADAEELLATDVEARWTEYDVPAVEVEGDTQATEEANSAKNGKQHKRTSKRTRATPEEKKEKEEASKVYRHSQKRLRHEAKNFSLKEIFTKSLLSPLDDSSRSTPNFPMQERLFSFPDGNSRGHSNYASPTGVVTPASPTTPWSPTMVGDITSHFLTAVRHKQQQTFQKIISKEMGKSQGMSMGPSPNGLNPSFSKADDNTASSPVFREEEELVIGEVEITEVASRTPQSGAQIQLEGCLSNGEMPSVSSLHDFTDSQRLPSYVGKAAAAKEVDPAEVTSKRAAEKKEEEELVRTLTRRHEMWKLQQRKIKSDRMVEQDSQLTLSRHESGTLSSNNHHHHNNNSPHVIETAPKKAEAPTTFLDVTLRQRQTNIKSIKGTNISMDDISMIRRINSFDNTSSQKVVVFGTVQSKDQSNSKSATF